MTFETVSAVLINIRLYPEGPEPVPLAKLTSARKRDVIF